MQPFKLPNFYRPLPARQNPNLNEARMHSKAWAKEMGILEQDRTSTWNESVFDKHDYALFCAYIHPEAPTPELNLMTDWNVWGFYLDDYFLRVYKQAHDYIGGKTYLDRVPLFMPIDLSPVPVPANPMERGLADLWLRTAPGKSEAWRRRIAEDMRNLWDAFLWELNGMNHQRLANPIEYVEMRRQVGAALWSADLVEHAMFVEIPERIVSTRPMRVLKNTFADAVHLSNDIFSYEREVLKEGELTNAVLVMERFLGADPQQAANVVNDLVTSRMEQFEHTVSTELGAIFEEYHLDAQEQYDVFAYIRGLREWQSGAQEWHIQTSRYLNPKAALAPTPGRFSPHPGGLGTSAAHIASGLFGIKGFKHYKHTPYKKVGLTRLPQFYTPFTTSMNPHLDVARENAKTWVRNMGMLDPLPTHPHITIWDERRFDVTDLTFFNALLRPNASPARLELMMYWNIWGTYTDDFFPTIYGHTRDLAGAKACHARLSAFMPISGTTSPKPVPLNPVERGLADIWMRSTEAMPVDDQRAFRKVVEEMIGSWVWEIFNLTQNYIPDPIEYMEMRRKTSGSDFVMVLPRAGNDQIIPVEVYRTLTLQELHRSAVDCVCLTNDIFSYQKEIEFEGDVHNGVLVIENFFGCDKTQAVEIVNRLITARLQQFEHIVAVELPRLFDNFNLDVRAREGLLAYVVDLQHFISSALAWHFKTSRYDEVEIRRSTSPKSLFDGPAGLGAAAVHLLSGVHLQPPPSIPSGTAQTPKPFSTSHYAPAFLKKKKQSQVH